MDAKDKIKLGRMVSTAIQRSKAYQRYQETVRWELSMYTYTGIYALDDAKIFDDISSPIIAEFAKKFGLDCGVVEDAYDLYTHSFGIGVGP